MRSQPDIPAEYLAAESGQLQQRIAARKAQLGADLVILGHHYQSDEVIQFADFTGDSLKLSQLAAAQAQARYIVFCGVHFMAESADILAHEGQAVCLPNLYAGCAMADMADEADAAQALEDLRELGGGKVVPVTYVNSTAALKALTARHGGACCTSGNVQNVFRWALASPSEGGAGAERVLAIPDEHLGRNTAVALGWALDDCAVYDPRLPRGGLSAEQVARARFILWKGHCYVHQVFTPRHVQAVRRQHPDIKVIVHPECPYEVVQLADAAGSTEQIIRAIASAEPGSRWAVGTEAALVQRLARRHADRFVRVLSDVPSYCAQMKRIDLPHLLWVLDNLAEGRVVNQVKVPPAVAADARTALQRMLDIRRTDQPTPTRKGPP
jgi:quinolinate synthase